MIYDIILADLLQRQHHFENRRFNNRNLSALRRCLTVRYANRQTAEETLPYLLRKFDVGYILTMSRTGDEVGRVAEMLRGRWDQITEFETLSECVLNPWNMTWIKRHAVRTGSPTTHIDATGLLGPWDYIAWPVEQRMVRSITILHTDSIATFNQTPDLLLYLALFTHYFPLLKELRLRPSRRTMNVGHYLIVGNEVRDWNTREVKWRLPTVTFQN